MNTAMILDPTLPIAWHKPGIMLDSLVDPSPTLQDARDARLLLLKGSKVALAGVGIASRGGILGLKVNVSKAADRKSVPKNVNGVPVHEVVVIGDINAFGAS